MKYLSRLVTGVMILAAVAVGAQQAEPGPNLLINPGAEIQPVTAAGWRQASGDWSKPKSGTSGNGSPGLFWGGAQPRAELYQDVSLAAFGPWLSEGGKKAVFRGYLNSFKDDADSSEVIVEALAANGAVLKSATTGPKNLDTWTLATVAVDLPATAAMVRLRLVAVRAAGNDNNGYFDDLGLYLVGPDGKPPFVGTPQDAEAPSAVAVRRSGLRPVLQLDFNGDTLDRSAGMVPTGNFGVAFATSDDGSTYGVFDGKRSRVEVNYPQETRLDRMTVMVRLRSTFSKTWQAILNNKGWSPTNMHLQFLGSALELAINGTEPGNSRPGYDFRPGVWYDIVITYDAVARTSTVYVNGAKLVTTGYTRTAPYVLSQLDVGAWDGEDRYFSGQIDYLYVLNGAMTERDVMSSFQSPAAPQTAAAVTAPPSRAPADRAGPVTRIQPYFGSYGTSAKLETTDGIRNGRYTDTYEYQATAGEVLRVMAQGEDFEAALSATAPGGQAVALSPMQNGSLFETTAPSSGLYTIRVSATDPTRLGNYYLSLVGLGQETRGKLDPFNDRRDVDVIFDSVDLKIEKLGWYRIDLFENLHRGRLTLRDKDYGEVARNEGATRPLRIETLLGPGTYHVIIDDDAGGGEWRVVVTMTFEGAGS